MRKRLIPGILALCLFACVLALSSCNGNRAANETAPETVTTEDVTTGHAHVPEAEYTVDLPPTCAYAGSKSYHCAECGQIIAETVVAIDPLPHVPAAEYVVDVKPTCSSPGVKSKRCTECGDIVRGSIEEIPIDPKAHDVEAWNVDKEPTLLDPAGHRSGVCKICAEPLEEDTVFLHDVQIFDTSSGKYSISGASLGEIRGSKHFYSTDEHPEGNDLLVEYSILWNETLLNLYNTNDVMPAVDTRFTTNQAGTSGNKGIVRLELANGTTSQWCVCKFAGGMTAFGSPEADCLYPRTDATINDATAYPNIGGANKGDGQAHGDPQWGWHRVGIRFREEVTNVEAVKGGAAATYYIQLWVYIDGILVFHNSGTDHLKNDGSDRKLFSAKSDGAGGITYTENDQLYLHGAFLDSKRMKDGVGYFEIADYSATVGSNFVQNVKKASDPTPATLEVEAGVTIPATIWYELAD